MRRTNAERYLERKALERKTKMWLRILDQDVNVSDLPEYVQKIIDDYKHEIDWR
jgi:hypothetical protein